MIQLIRRSYILLPQREWIFSRFGLKILNTLWSGIGYGFRGKGVSEDICRFNSKGIRKNDNMRIPGAHQLELPSPLISWANPLPSRFRNRTPCFLQKVSYSRESRMWPWKLIMLDGWSGTQKPVLWWAPGEFEMDFKNSLYWRSNLWYIRYENGCGKRYFLIWNRIWI